MRTALSILVLGLAGAAEPACAADRIFTDGFEPCCTLGGEVSGLTGTGLVLHLAAAAISEDKPVTANGGGYSKLDDWAEHVVIDGNLVTPLIHGSAYFADLCAALEATGPGDLVLLDVDFTFEAIDPRRFLRQEASEALNELFAASEAARLPLLGVSGFRSAETQAELFDDYAATDGVVAADRYSARPGHSEHQSGLAIDVVGADGECPTVACFAERPEAAWLAAHAHEHGFIIRYPRDGETSTGYLYEPWHLRYVGPKVAAEIYGNDETLEQHLGLP